MLFNTSVAILAQVRRALRLKGPRHTNFCHCEHPGRLTSPTLSLPSVMDKVRGGPKGGREASQSAVRGLDRRGCQGPLEWRGAQRLPRMLFDPTRRFSGVCSVQRRAITALAGGDCDGDDVCISFNPVLVAFFRATQSRLLPFTDAQEEAAQGFSGEEGGKHRDLQHLEWALYVPTPNVRGLATAMAERAQDATLCQWGGLGLVQSCESKFLWTYGVEV